MADKEVRDESKKAEERINNGGRQKGDETPLFNTAAEEFKIDQGDMTHHGLSHAIGLEEVPGSVVPETGVAHVRGPQQSAVDPHAAGLDLESRPVSRNANRAIHRTGTSAGGNRPGNRSAADDGVVEDGSVVKAHSDKDASRAIGPSGG